MQASALVPVRDMGEPVRRLEGEFAEDLRRITRSPGTCGSAGSAATADGPGSTPRRDACSSRARAHPSAGAAGGGSRGPRKIPGGAPSCGKTSLSSSPLVSFSGAPAFGLTQIQSSPAGASCVPLVSTATSNPAAWQGLDGRLVELQERFAAGADDERARPRVMPAPRHVGSYRRGQFHSGGEPSAARAVRTHEVGVAELADRASTILFPAGPQVATGEPAEHCGSAGMGTLTLKGVEDLLDPVGHPVRPSAG